MQRGRNPMKSHLSALVVMLAAGFATHATAGERPIGLYEFSGASGYAPGGGVITDKVGNVFGTTTIGGNGSCLAGAGCGTIYELSPSGNSWTFNVIYNFQGGQDGSSPSAQLTHGPNGSLFGYTAAGSYGTVFQLSPPSGGTGPWTFQILYVFQNKNDGNLAYFGSPLVFHHDALYGVAMGGSNACGQAGCGSVFKLTPPAGGSGSWNEKTLYQFPGGAVGGEPNSIVGPDASKSLYVSTLYGNGTVVQVSPAGGGKWTGTVITTFNGGSDGYSPASLVLANSGALYGIAAQPRAGFAFQLTNSNGTWTRTRIAKIAHKYYGPNSLAAGASGSLIGVIEGDFDFFPGAVFQLTPPVNGGSWTYTQLCTFRFGPDRNPLNVVTGLGGNLFGVLNGGDSGNGGLFEVK